MNNNYLICPFCREEFKVYSIKKIVISCKECHDYYQNKRKSR